MNGPSPVVTRSSCLAAVAWALCGCGGPPTATVRGTVTLDGRPVSGGTVLFEGGGCVFGGAIGRDGTYELRDRGGPHVVPGTYAVAVVPPEPTYVVDEKTTEVRRVGGGVAATHPRKYRDPSTSGLVQEVPEGRSRIDLELTAD